MKKDTKSRLTHRIKIIQGQTIGLEKMITNGAYCMDIVTQSLAVQKSLASLSKLTVAHHIETHITDMMASGKVKEQQKARDELAVLFELINVRGK